MSARLTFDMVSPEEHLFSAEVDVVTVPGSEGDFGVLANHSPMMSVLRPGIVLVEDGGTTTRYFVQGGFADVTPDGLTILAELALDVDGDDKDALQNAVTEARSRVEIETDEQKKAEAGSILRVLEEIQ
ncbi:MAG: F0F1 ATP synthase subunit epsilon [Rhodobiaceae bacterium]|nr:F0F1 ATP synthase subunit epsilon [Rhodobiaceae bacterium]